MSKLAKRPLLLIVRDGWGHNPFPEWNHANAVHLAKTPVDHRLRSSYPWVQIRTCGEDVGLPAGVMGNSEVGHQNIGAGRIVDQEQMRITRTVRDGSFYRNEKLNAACAHAKKNGGALHIMGLASDAGVHSALEHLYAILELAKRAGLARDQVLLHAFTDGRDTPPNSGIEFIRQIEAKMREIGVGRVATVIGRFYAMDRDNRWDRVEKAYRLLTEAKGAHIPESSAGVSAAQPGVLDRVSLTSSGPSAAELAFQNFYDHPTDANRHGDEFIEPTVIGEPRPVRAGDAVIFFNFRGDRPREITKAFVYDEFPFATVPVPKSTAASSSEQNLKSQIPSPASEDSNRQIAKSPDRQMANSHASLPDSVSSHKPEAAAPIHHEAAPPHSLLGFDRGPKIANLYYCTMCDYEKSLPVQVAFTRPPKMANILGAYWSALGLTQFRCAETEKYPHVTFFFNDYRDEPFSGEDRQIIPSPRDVTTYDQKPEMSALGVTEEMLRRIATDQYDLFVLNYANGDMVGHTGKLDAAIKAVETVDACVGRVVDAVIAKGGAAIVTADHGNCEQMIDPATGCPHTSHTTYDVDLIVVDDRYKGSYDLATAEPTGATARMNGIKLRTGGRLADIAPTLLKLGGVAQPKEMDGQPLIP